MGTVQAALVAAALAAGAWRAGALTRSGALAAAAVGAVTLSAGGWPGGVVLMAFFLPGSAVSRIWPGPELLLDPKGDRRDAWQVLANGGAPALALALGGPGAALGFAAGLAAAAADTWATAIGAHSALPPRHILTARVVPPGTSGGITALGTVGAAVGAVFVAGSAIPMLGWHGAAIAAGIGIAGMFLDAVLGAGLQGRFRCEHCGQESERKVHRCGHPTRFIGGWGWMSNDWVNALATLTATAAGWAAGAGWSWS